MAEKAYEKHSLSLPWKTRVLLRGLSVVSDTALRADGTINRRLLNFFAFTVSPNPKPVRGVRTKDLMVDKTRRLWFRLFDPVGLASDGVKLPVIFFFHGGGFATLGADAAVYDFACRRFALKVPAIVVSVNYRLAPEHPFPAQHEDGFDVLKYVDEHPSVLPDYADLSRSFLAGDSAGGNLAHFMAVKAAQSSSKFHNLVVRGLIAIQPFFGGEEKTEAEVRLPNAPIITQYRTDCMWRAYVPGSNRDHGAINVTGPNAMDLREVKDFPRSMVVVGGFDPLQDWQRKYYEWLKQSGKEVELIEYPTAIHAFYLFPELPESSLLFNEVKKFINGSSGQ
uniref:Alpha/beta hydrolase fold-3 domain-containing protein n=1 Tax=Kalanchoe fedtschenkoi TaxID=63787 RepID=A0A7N0U4H4_KALFE